MATSAMDAVDLSNSETEATLATATETVPSERPRGCAACAQTDPGRFIPRTEPQERQDGGLRADEHQRHQRGHRDRLPEPWMQELPLPPHTRTEILAPQTNPILNCLRDRKRYVDNFESVALFSLSISIEGTI